MGGCTAQPPDPDTRALESTLASLDLGNPDSDATRNFDKGDFRLVGVNGFTCYLPGTRDPAQEELARENGVRCLDGTSDTGSRKLNRQAAVYARRYNEALVRLMRP